MKRDSIHPSSLVLLPLPLTDDGAYEQSCVKASVPFAFQVRTQQLPAGTYRIEKETGSDFIMLQNLRTGASVIALGRSGLCGKMIRKLIFHYVGGQYFLSQIWGVAGTGGMAVLASNLEN
jgi:hypothetical protein